MGTFGLLLAALGLYGLTIAIQPLDPIAFLLATLLLSGVLMAASWGPARRAARMDPMRALRAE